MADIIKIPWAEGGGNITISSTGGDVSISSDTNTGVERTQVLTFRAGSASAKLIVRQKGSRVILKDASDLILQDRDNKILTAKIG